jgi:hypothetical protein
VAVQNHLVELNRGVSSPCPITLEFKRLCRSSQLASQTKRSYKAMQGANNRISKLPKKLKLAADKSATNESATSDSATDEPPTNVPSTDEPPIDKPPIDESPNEPTTLKSINDLDTIESLKTSREAPALASLIEGDETTISKALESDLPTITHTNGIAILDKYFPRSTTDLRPLNSAVPDEVPTSIANTVC